MRRNRFERTTIAIALAAACSLAAARAQETSTASIFDHGTGVITPRNATRHVEALASDGMLGRNTPSPELDSAARYIAGVFQSVGAEPVAGSYFQTYNLKQKDLGAVNSFSVDGRAFELRSGFNPFEFSPSGSVDAATAFVGYGLSRPDSGYDDYAGIDVKGKIVVAIDGAPSDDFRSDLPLISAGNEEKMRVASAHGAAGFLLLANPRQSRFMRAAGYLWGAYFKRGSGVLNYQLDLPSPITAIPSAGINGDAGRAVLGRSIDQIAAMVRRIDSTGRPASIDLPSRVAMRIEITETVTSVRNVVATVRGRVLPDEYVVIGAHYDHIGHYGGSGGRKGEDTIFNGADDNASGTAGLLMAAHAFSALPPAERPARSILFIAFSGEEKGLYGSRAYVASPLAPIEKTVAMLNMDMIGRNFRDSISVAGHTRSKDMRAIAEIANRDEPLVLADDLEDMFERSDQASFAAKRIPVLFFSSGLHRDYHQVSDSPDRIDPIKLAHVARLCFRTAWLVADAAERPRFEDPHHAE